MLTASRYSGAPFDLVFYISDQGLESGWWPLGSPIHFNDLVDKAPGCKVGFGYRFKRALILLSQALLL